MSLLKKSKFTILLLCLSFITSARGQVIILSNANFTGSSMAGPMNTSTSAGAASRYAYIYPQATVSSLRHGDSIRSVSFMRNGGGAITGTSNLKIFMRTTVNNNYGANNINWVNQTGATSMKKVYDKNPISDIGSNSGWVRFEFTSPFVVDTVFGKNLEILVEYTQTSAQSASVFWNFENSASVSGLAANQTKFVRTNGGVLTDTTNSSTEWHPSIRIEFPRNDFDMAMVKLYALGKLPVPLGNPDTVRAIVQNVGKKTKSFKIYFKSTGANHLIDSAAYTLNYLDEKIVNLPLLNPANTGLDTLIAFIKGDQVTANDTQSVIRLATSNIYSYKDPNRPIVGGIGFNGSTGDFVAKFYANSAKAINQIGVSFAGANQKFKLGIWKADGKQGAPGTNVWTSDTLITATNFITPVWPPVNVTGNFFVGVRQIGNTNVAFGYQPEDPVRPSTFYYAAPMGDTNWVDFAPDAPYKFAIEPRIQAANDVAPITVIKPKDTMALAGFKTMAPKVKIINYGANHQNNPFAIKMNILRYGQLQYSSVKWDTLSSGRQSIIVFDSSFLPSVAGDYDVQVMTLLPSDQMKDNDTLKSKFTIAVYQDVGPTTVFDPSMNYDYEQFVDTIYPTVFIQNYGLDKQGPFVVRAEIYDSTKSLIYSDFKSYTLTALNSVLASFNPFPCSVKGRYTFKAFTTLSNDLDKSNDTVVRNFKIIRSNDVAISKIVYPVNQSTLNPPVSSRQPEAELVNLGDLNQGDPFWSYCDIYYNSNRIYSDSIYMNVFTGTPQTLLFKTFKPVQKGYYKVLVYSGLSTDQFPANDTMISQFAVGVPDDVEVISIEPAKDAHLQLNRLYATKVTIRNNGYNAQNTAFPLVFKVSQGASLQYIKIQNITIDSGKTKTFDLDSTLFVDELVPYKVQVYTMLNKDFIRKNDTVSTWYYPVKAYDIGASQILFPTANDTLLLNTQYVKGLVKIKNFGDSLVKETFTTTLQMFNANTMVPFYNVSLDSNLLGKDSMILEFPGITIGSPSMPVICRAFTTWTNDQFVGNDSSQSKSQFMVVYDAASNRLNWPQNNTRYQLPQANKKPQVQIKSNAIKPMNGLSLYYRIMRLDTINLTESPVYFDTLMVNSLMPQSISDFDLNKDLDLVAIGKGKYKIYVNAVQWQDQVPQNNTLTGLFWVDEKTSITQESIEGIRFSPNPCQGLLCIHNPNAITTEVEILDPQGRVCMKCQLNQSQHIMNLESLATGVYYLKIGTKTSKLLVEQK